MTIDQATPTSRGRSRTRRIAAATCVLALGLGVGGAEAQTAPSIEPASVQHEQAPPFQGPPPVRLADGSVTLLVRPYGSCWSGPHQGVCFDGAPPRPLPSLGGTAGPVRLGFAADGWHFKVTLVDTQGHQTPVELIQTGPREWRLVLGDLSDGHYRIDIFGRGPQGDVVAAAALSLH